MPWSDCTTNISRHQHLLRFIPTIPNFLQLLLDECQDSRTTLSDNLPKWSGITCFTSFVELILNHPEFAPRGVNIMKLHLLPSVFILLIGVATGWVFARAQEPKQEGPPPRVVNEPGEVEVEKPLDTLDWLVGDWVDEQEKVSIEISCHYTKNRAFLLRTFRIVKENEPRISGMQLIAWDPARETIRSWTYDSNGGFGEESWSQSGNRYTLRSKYTLPDGGIGSNLQVIQAVDDNKLTWQSVDRFIDGKFQPDTEEITLVRKTEGDEEKGAKE
jgi:hypothetical protein